MNKQKNKVVPAHAPKSQDLHAFALTLGIVAVLFGLMFLSAIILPRIGLMQDDNFYLARVFLSSANLLLIAYLIFVYTKDYLALRSGFTMGLLFFMCTFMLYAISTCPLLHSFFGLRGMGGGVGIFSVLPTVFNFVALLIFTKISSQ